MSDHGMRFGNIRKTHIGQLEQRLPMLFIALPKLFREQFPQYLSNLRHNANKLTTPFDLYVTWLHLLHLEEHINKGNKSKRAISMFQEIPEERSCADASVDPHWCACAMSSAVNTNDSIVTRSSQFFINAINENLKPVKSVCEQLRLHQIKNAKSISMLSKTMNGDIRYHRLIVHTQPGDGLFEGTIVYNTLTNTFTLGSAVDRINSYGKENKCGVNYLLEKLCYCKSNTNV